MSAVTTTFPFGLGGAWLAEHTLRTVGAGLALFDDDARLVQADRRAAQLLSLDDDDDVGMRLDDPRWSAIRLDGALVDRASDPVAMALADDRTSVADIVGVADEWGDTRWLAITALPIPSLNGAPYAALASFVEVTGVIRDRAAVDHAERLGRSTFDRTATPMCVVDASGCLVDWNAAFAQQIGVADIEIMATGLDRWVDGADAVLGSAVDGGVPAMRTRWTDGTPAVVRCWPATADDPTRITVELATRAACQGDLFNRADGPTLVLDASDRISSASGAFAELVGTSAESLRGNRVELFLPGVPSGAIRRYLDGVRSDGSPKQFQTRLARIGAPDLDVEVSVWSDDSVGDRDVVVTFGVKAE